MYIYVYTIIANKFNHLIVLVRAYKNSNKDISKYEEVSTFAFLSILSHSIIFLNMFLSSLYILSKYYNAILKCLYNFEI